MTHDLAFAVDADGVVAFVFHPNDDQAIKTMEAIGAEVGERAGYVWPAPVVLRFTFRALRAVFGGRGRIADWTRHWHCQWVVVIAETGKQLPGTFKSHDDGVEAEVAWSLKA